VPVNKHLEFVDITDFTPGYFSVGEWLMPVNGSQEMTDCRPDPGGGLRASAKPTAFSTSGLPVTTAKVCGLYTRGAIALQSGAPGDARDRYIALYDTADNKVKIYRWNETLTATPTSWSLVIAHAAVNAIPNPVTFDTFVDSTGTAHVFYTLFQTSTDDGLWSIPFSYVAAGTSTRRISGISPIGLGVQDDRVITASASTLRWSDSQSATSFPAANTLNVQASRQGNSIVSITAFAPGDLLIGTRFSAWTLVQGSITDPVVRTMSDARSLGAGQRGAFTDKGLAFVSPLTGVFITNNGESFNDISTQIAQSLWQYNANNGDVGNGECVFTSDFLAAPHGLFWDTRTQAWFRSSVLITNKDHFHTWADTNYREFFSATGGNSFSLYTFGASEATRWNTYTWKSASFHRPDNRQIRIREVQVIYKSYDASATIAVTVNGTTRTITAPTTGRQQTSFLFSEQAEVLDVQIVPTAGSSSNEAPSIEAVRVGSQSYHQTY
jgi:hypothetical protein